MNRSPEEVLEDHLRQATEGSVDTDLESNYDPDVVVLRADGVLRGHDGLRAANDRLQRELPEATYRYRAKVVAGDVAFLEWEATSAAGEVRDGADSYVIRDGRIIAQTIHYTVESPVRRDPDMRA